MSLVSRGSNSIIERLRGLFQRRVKDSIFAVLGDSDAPGARVDVPGRMGYVYVRFPGGRNADGFSNYSSPVMARSAGAAFPNVPGFGVYVAYGDNGELEIKSAHYQSLDNAGVNTSVLNPLNQQSKWVYPWQLTYGLADAVATFTTASYLVTVKSFRHFVANRFQTFETPDEASKIDMSSFIPAADEHCYAAVWVDTYTNTATVTRSTPQNLLTAPMDLTDIQELVTGRPADAMPLKGFYLSNGQITLMTDAQETDLRQHMDTPVPWGFPVASTLDERVRPGYALVTPPYTTPLTIETGGKVVIVHKNTFNATTAPTVTDDSDDGYTISSAWFNKTTGILYFAEDVTVGAAVWTPVTGSGGPFAPANAHYVTTQAESGLTNEFSLGTLGTGLVKITVASSIATPSIAIANTDYVPPTGAILTSPVINTGVSGTAIVDDATFASPSSTTVPTTNAVKGYVDQTVLGLSAKADVRLATAAALPALIYANGSSGVGATLTGVSTGVLTIDGVTVALNDRLLIKDQAAGLQNGIYKCTIAGAVGVAFILTRTTDGDTDSELRGCWMFSTEGTANALQGWLNTNTTAITFGTTAITFGEFSAGAITAGDGLTKTGNSLAVNSTVIRTTGTQAIANGLTLTTPAIASLANAQHNHTNAAGGGQLTDAALSAAVSIAKGGTGQTTQTDAFDALAPTTTQGDLIYHNGTDNVRLAKGTALQYLRMNAGATAEEWASLASVKSIAVLWTYYNSSATWTKPSDAFLVTIICIGAGGGGGSGRRGASLSTRAGGSGGAAGAITQITVAASQLGSSVAYTVGSAGTGGVARTANDQSGANGGDGGGTNFGNVLLAIGGLGGLGGNNAVGGVAGGVGNITLGRSFQFYGSSGGASQTAADQGAWGPGGGGGAGGISSANSATSGSAGASAQVTAFGFPASGGGGSGGSGAVGTAGTAGVTDGSGAEISGAGGGGGGSNATLGFAGGNGGEPGGGGGGGSPSVNGNNSGAGGNGGSGGIYVITYRFV